MAPEAVTTASAPRLRPIVPNAHWLTHVPSRPGGQEPQRLGATVFVDDARSLLFVCCSIELIKYSYK